MRLHRFYIPDISISHAPSSLTISYDGNELHERLLHQWKEVFRFGAGDRIMLFNADEGEWLAEFISIDKKNGAALSIVEQNRVANKAIPAKNIALYMAIIKNSNFDLVVEKATELGVSRIIPVLTDRTVKSGLNFERLNKLAIEASEQSGRMDVPEISEIMSLDEAIDDTMMSAGGSNNDSSGALGTNDSLIYFGHIDENENRQDFAKEKSIDSNKISLFIGPEGGWTEKEVETFLSKNIKPISLGQFVLRAETAAIAGLVLLNQA